MRENRNSAGWNLKAARSKGTNCQRATAGYKGVKAGRVGMRIFIEAYEDGRVDLDEPVLNFVYVSHMYDARRARKTYGYEQEVDN
jgi:hypothetical protein